MGSIPGIAQSLHLEEHTVLTWEDVHQAARDVLDVKAGVARERVVEVAPRYFLT